MLKKNCIYCFKNLSVNSRANIYLSLLKVKKADENTITKLVDLKQPTVNYHLNSMVKSGLLTKTAKGKNAYFSINTNCPHDGHVCILKDD